MYAIRSYYETIAANEGKKPDYANALIQSLQIDIGLGAGLGLDVSCEYAGVTAVAKADLVHIRIKEGKTTVGVDANAQVGFNVLGFIVV